MKKNVIYLLFVVALASCVRGGEGPQGGRNSGPEITVEKANDYENPEDIYITDVQTINYTVKVTLLTF